jgi:hypothetical protein
MADYDHSAGLQFTPGLDHAHASMRNDNAYAEESQEVYVTNTGQTYLQDLESNGDLPVTATDTDRRSGIQPKYYSWLPVWLRNSPTFVKVTTAGAALLVVIFIAIMASGIAKLPSNDETTKFNSSANTGTDNESTDAGSNTGSINPFPLPTKEPTTAIITSSPVAAAQVPATPPPSTQPPATPPPSPEAVVPIPTTPAPTQPPVTTSEPTEQPTPLPALTCPKDLSDFVTIDQSAVLYYAIVPTESGDNGIMCGRLEVLNHKGWVGVAISLDGLMIGSDAIIGEPSTKSVFKYNLNGKGANLVNTMDAAKQTLKDTSIVEDKGSTIMTFTKQLVEPGEIPITPRGKNIFLHARGDDTTIGYHSTKGTFVLDFSSTNPPTPQPTEGATTPQPTVVPALADSALICTEYSPCNQCLGSCDSDFHCAGELQCFRRNYGEPVPGCLGQGNYGQNYCYNPFADGATVLLTNNTQECDKKAPCGKCFGSCSADEDCDKNLFCYRRFDDPFRPIPGCAGQGEPGTNYCFDPNDIP